MQSSYPDKDIDQPISRLAGSSEPPASLGPEPAHQKTQDQDPFAGVLALAPAFLEPWSPQPQDLTQPTSGQTLTLVPP